MTDTPTTPAVVLSPYAPPLSDGIPLRCHDPMRQAIPLLQGAVACLLELEPVERVKRLAYIAERVVYSVPIPFEPVYVVELFAEDPHAFELYLQAHERLLTNFGPPASYDAEYHSRCIAGSLVLALLKAYSDDYEDPDEARISIRSVLEGSVAALRQCSLSHPRGPERHLQATFEALDAALLAYPANDNSNDPKVYS